MNSRYRLHHKTPISLVLMLLLNIVLVVTFELLVFYRFPAPPTSELLAKTDSRYENCRVYSDSNFTMDLGVQFYMVETKDGQKDLIPLGTHAFFPSRNRLYSGKIIRNLDLTQNSSQQLMIGTKIYQVTVNDGDVWAMMAMGSSSQQAVLAKYLGLGGLFAFLEMLIWEKIRGNL